MSYGASRPKFVDKDHALLVSIFLSRLLHAMYLIFKNSPDQASTCESFFEALRKVLKDAIRKELRKEQGCDDVERYLKAWEYVKRWMPGALQFLETTWNLSLSQNAMHIIVGNNAMRSLQMAPDILVSSLKPLRLYVNNCVMLPLQIERSDRDHLRLLIALFHKRSRYMQLLRIVLRKPDAHVIWRAGLEGKVHILTHNAYVYPFQLRMLRLAHTKALRQKASNEFTEIASMLMREDDFVHQLISGDIRLSVLDMALAASPPVLCIPSVVCGEAEYVRIYVEGITLKVKSYVELPRKGKCCALVCHLIANPRFIIVFKLLDKTPHPQEWWVPLNTRRFFPEFRELFS